MSVILKSPKINDVIASCSAEQLTSIRNIINGSGISTPTSYTLIPNRPNTLSASNKGIAYATLEVTYGKDPALGILIYTDSYCAFCAISGPKMQTLDLLLINDGIVESTKEKLNINEFRRVLDEQAKGGGDEWVQEVKPYLVKLSDGGIRINGAFSVFDGSSCYIDHNATNHITSIYGRLNVGSEETPTPFNVNGTSTFKGNIHIDSGKKLKIGSTELSEAQLIALLALIQNG